METKNLRNVAILGHSGSGKTTLTESLLFNAKVIDRLGRVDNGTAASDFDPEEKKRKISISAAVAPLMRKDCKINLIDVPGYFDFEGEMIQACKVAEGAVIVLNGSNGIEVGTEKAWAQCKKQGTSMMMFVSQIDKEHVDFAAIVDDLKAKFGKSIAPIQLPIYEKGEFIGIVDVVHMTAHDTRTAESKEIPIPESMKDEIADVLELLTEAVAETDDDLLTKYFDEGALSSDEIRFAMRKGTIAGTLIPVLCGSGYNNAGIDLLARQIAHYLPSPIDAQAPIAEVDGEEVEVACDQDAPFSAFIFKTIVDQFVGKLSLFKVMSGKIEPGMTVYNPFTDVSEKVGNVYSVACNKQSPEKQICAGDIGAFSKLSKAKTGHTLCEPNNNVKFADMEFPKPSIAVAIESEKADDEEKVFTGLKKLMDEDKTFAVEKNGETNQTLISGAGEMQMDIIASKLKAKFGVGIKFIDRKVAYRETIRKQASLEGRHKKQSGGHGQFGHVWIRFEPNTESDEQFVFGEEVVGGVVPKGFIPAVEKGLLEIINKGPLAGYPMTGLKATLYDGSYHPVDSNEMSFKMAARAAFKKLDTASPVLLEPVMSIAVIVPDDYMGDIIGDLNKRRGRIMGMDSAGNGLQKIDAEVPEAEIFKYATDLRSMTQGRGSFSTEFARYEEVPASVSAKIVEEARKNMTDDED